MKDMKRNEIGWNGGFNKFKLHRYVIKLLYDYLLDIILKYNKSIIEHYLTNCILSDKFIMEDHIKIKT